MQPGIVHGDNDRIMSGLVGFIETIHLQYQAKKVDL